MSSSGMFSILTPGFDRAGEWGNDRDRLSYRFGYANRYDRRPYDPTEPEDSIRLFRPPFLWRY